MKKIILAALLLASCSETATDKYTFEKGTGRLRPERQITVVTHPSLDDLRKEKRATGAVAANRDLMAYSIISQTKCTVHIVDPAVKYMPEFIGHEITHCLYGEFHPTQNN
jgi:hypothetical protein